MCSALGSLAKLLVDGPTRLDYPYAQGICCDHCFDPARCGQGSSAGNPTRLHCDSWLPLMSHTASSLLLLLLKAAHSAHNRFADAISFSQCGHAVGRSGCHCCLDGAATAPALQCMRAGLSSLLRLSLHFFHAGSEETSTSMTCRAQVGEAAHLCYWPPDMLAQTGGWRH